jgi:hypothetical protein
MCAGNKIKQEYGRGPLGKTTKSRFLRTLLIPGSEGFSGIMEWNKRKKGEETDDGKGKEKRARTRFARGETR